MFRILLAIVSIATLGYASQIGVVHTPSYVQFAADRISVPLSEIQSQLQHIMGFSVTSGKTSFVPFAQSNLFRRPKAVVAIEIDGLDNLPMEVTRSFDLIQDSEDADLTSLFASVRRTFEKDGSLLVDYDGTVSVDAALGGETAADASPQDVQADAAMVLQDAELTAAREGVAWSLKPTEPLDAAFLVEMRRLLTMCTRIRTLGARTTDSVPDVFAFRIRAFAQLAQFYGIQAAQTQDALRMLRFLISKMQSVFRDAYDSNVVVLVFGLDSSASDLHYRMKRAVSSSEPSSTAPEPEPPAINLAPAYIEDYAAFFNILLWLVVGIAITVLLISWVLWTMDPGRDSIIYRMVQLPRIKKDN